MDATGGHDVKLNKPGPERQRPHVFSDMWKIDPKDKHKNTHGQVPVAHAYNPSYSGGKDQKDRSSKAALANSL
jgi:hypothetical protein